MFGFLKRLFNSRPSEEPEIDPESVVNEQWQADFSREDEPARPSRVRFSIASENLYRAYLSKGALCLGIKKAGCIAWTENMFFRYQDLYMKGHFVLDPQGGYAAAGFSFRMVDDFTYYMALVSSVGYFRLDLVRNNVPMTLAGWTEASGIKDISDAPFEFDLELVTFGPKIMLAINGFWSGTWDDPSISEGRIAFAAASYEGEAFASQKTAAALMAPKVSVPQGEFIALAKLVEFRLDSRIEEVEKSFNKLEDSALPDSRIRLAETFTALGLANPALIQLRKAWETRIVLSKELDHAEDKVILAAIQTEGLMRTTKELLLGAKLAMVMELWDEAEEYIGALKGEEAAQEARNMKASLFYSRRHYTDLIQWAVTVTKPDTKEKPAAQHSETKKPQKKRSYDNVKLDFKKLDKLFADPSAFYILLGNSFFNTGNYQKAAEVYDHSFELDPKNGIAAKNAGAAYEILNKKDQPAQKEKALDRYLKAGRIFLADNRYEELGLLIPKFRLLGGTNCEARALIGKWAFGIDDWKTAGEELDAAEKLRKTGGKGKLKHGSEDPALYFLQALLLVREGRRQDAQPLFEKAVKCAPDYLLFRFRRAENRFLLNNDSDDPKLAADLEAALKIKKEEEPETYGWVHNFAAHVALSKGDVEKARVHMENAAAVLGEIPAIRVNRAVSLYLQGLEADALNVLESKPEEDPEGLMANCAGNLLVRSRRFEEADAKYLRALAVAPFNAQYRYNRGACLIELGRYGEADDVLTTNSRTRNFSTETNPDMLELIAFVAAKKGEYKRAETASRAALKINPHHAPSLLQLGWIRAFAGRWDEVTEMLDHLDTLELNKDATRGRDDLRKWMWEALYKIVSCASCKREWEVERNPPQLPANFKLLAMPPDDMPAGTCPGCGNTYCVGCRKEALDESGRFVCPDCGKTLKLTDEGIKAMLNDWAHKNLKKKPKKTEEAPAEETAIEETAIEETATEETAMEETPAPDAPEANGKE